MIGVFAAAALLSAPAVGPRIDQPDWARLPSARQMSEAYPAAAQALGLDGRARITCDVDRLGRLEKCRVDAEGPPGLGFGEASLRIAEHFQMRPKMQDGRPVEGGSVTVPIQWKFPRSGAASGPVDRRPPPALETLALARRLTAALSPDAVAEVQIRAITAEIGRLADGLAPDARRSLSVALGEAVMGELPALRERVALEHARLFSPSDLAELVRFFESPAGKAYVAAQPQLQRVQAGSAAAISDDLRARARAAFCARHDCSDALPLVSPVP